MNLHHRIRSILSTTLSSHVIAPLTARLAAAPLGRLAALPLVLPLALPLMLASLAGAAWQPAAQASPWRYSYNSDGSFGQGVLMGPGGYRLQQNHSQIGPFGSGKLRDNRGNTMRYNSSLIGPIYRVQYR